MSLIHNLMGNASEIKEVHPEVKNSLVTEEKVIKAYKLVRDEIVFTSKRVIFLDKQGVTGKKMDILSVPYKMITKFSKESAGTFDLDEELKIWVRGDNLPLSYQFKKGSHLDEVYQLLSQAVL